MTRSCYIALRSAEELLCALNRIEDMDFVNSLLAAVYDGNKEAIKEIRKGDYTYAYRI